MIDLYERHLTQAGYVDERLRTVPFAVTMLLLSLFGWAVIYAAVRFLLGV